MARIVLTIEDTSDGVLIRWDMHDSSKDQPSVAATIAAAIAGFLEEADGDEGTAGGAAGQVSADDAEGDRG